MKKWCFGSKESVVLTAFGLIDSGAGVLLKYLPLAKNFPRMYEDITAGSVTIASIQYL